MTVSEYAQKLSLKVFCAGDPDRRIEAGYCGDLLSFVMGRAPAGCAWFTVMTNVNVAAVAVLCDVACIVLAQGKEPDAQFAARAAGENLAVFGTEDDVYTAAVKFSRVFGG